MTICIEIPGTTAVNPIRHIKRWRPPVDDFDALFFTSDDLAKALVNCAPDGADATAVGTPAVGEAVTLTDGNYIDTGIAETAAITLVAVVRRHNAQVLFMGSLSTADSNGVALFTNGASPRKPVYSAKATSSPAVVSAATTWPVDPTKYEMIIGKSNPATLINSLYLPRTGERVDVAFTGTRGLSGRNIMIGVGPSPAASYVGDTTLGKLFGVAQRCLTDAEEDALYAWVAARIPGI
jgi:hypothetical protein